ncbi:MAG: hypothetical protein ACPGLY_19895 [Rubripirellula sp.]
MKAMVLKISALVLLLALNFGLASPSSFADEVVPPSPVERLARGLNPVNWQMPKWKMPDLSSLLPGNEEKARIKKKKDGFFGEVSNTASNSWNKTKAAFSPDKFSPMQIFPASSRTPSKTAVKPKRGFFESLFSPLPAREESNETVNQWLNQPRPQ